jgi:hypothetical protein
VATNFVCRLYSNKSNEDKWCWPRPIEGVLTED